MKKRIALLAVLCMIFSLAACSKETAKENETQNSLENKTTFIVGFDQDFPPFGYVDDNGEFTGFDIEMAKECASRMGLEIKLTPIDWDAKNMELSSGAIDCIWNGFTINGSEDDYTWSDAYMDNSQVVIVKKTAGISTLADLAGKIVEVQTDSSAQHALEDDEHQELTSSFGQLITVADYNTAFMDLEAGAVDAVIIDIGVANFQIEGKEDIFMILDESVSSEQYGIGFLKGNTELRDKVQATLMEMVEDGTFAEISNKWFGYDVCILGK